MTGLINLSASCFINESLQALMSLQNLQRAVNAFPPSVLSETERAFTEVVKRSRVAVEPFVPKQITDAFYRGRQGDPAEFVQSLFLACPSIANAIFQGAETTHFACQHCDYQRSSHSTPLSFNLLRLSLLTHAGERLTSVGQAIDCNQTNWDIVEYLDDWSCTSLSCIEAGQRKYRCRTFDRVGSWPDVLMVQLKRWSFVGISIDHNVDCDLVLHIDGSVYRLRAVVSHMGPTPEAGHYVSYVAGEDQWLCCNDSKMSAMDNRHVGLFKATSVTERSYVLMYEKVTGQPPLPPPPESPPVASPHHADDIDRDAKRRRLDLDLKVPIFVKPKSEQEETQKSPTVKMDEPLVDEDGRPTGRAAGRQDRQSRGGEGQGRQPTEGGRQE